FYRLRCRVTEPSLCQTSKTGKASRSSSSPIGEECRSLRCIREPETRVSRCILVHRAATLLAAHQALPLRHRVVEPEHSEMSQAGPTHQRQPRNSGTGIWIPRFENFS